MNTISVMRGTSGTGKGTRLNQLIMFLRTREEPEILGFKVQSPKSVKFRPYGLYFKSINTLIIGKYVKSPKSGLISFSSTDPIINNLTSYERISGLWVWGYDIVQIILETHRDKHVIIEGLAGLEKSEFSVEHLLVMGYKKILNQLFIVDSIEDIRDRTLQRSGKAAGAHGSIGINSVLLNQFDKVESNNKVIMDLQRFDSHVSMFGRKFISQVLEDTPLYNDFIRYSRFTKHFRHYEEKEKNKIYDKYIIEQKSIEKVKCNDLNIKILGHLTILDPDKDSSFKLKERRIRVVTDRLDSYER